MIKELQYKGYATEPSDYECPDGQLATSLNLINEDEQLKPVFQPSELAELPSGYKVVYIHDTNTFTHYILLNTSTNKLYWIDESIITDAAVKPVSSATIETELAQTSPSRELYSFGSTEIYNVNGIGNTLIVLTANGMHYLLWKGDTEGYLYLGTHLPELPISFGLQGEMKKTDTWRIDFGGRISESRIIDTGNDITDDTIINNLTNSILAKVNRFIAEESLERGRFIYPFLLRYAYRLFDGTLTMHSSPILMSCSSNITPVVYCPTLYNWHSEDNDEKAQGDFFVCAPVCALDYAVLSQTCLDALRNWKDIVYSVDIFISKPLYTYDQNGKVKNIVSNNADYGYTVCKHTNQKWSENTYPLRYQKRSFIDMYIMTFNEEGAEDQYNYPLWRAKLPTRTISQLNADIQNESSFYLLKSIKLENLTIQRTLVEVEKDYLGALVTKEVMTDDFDSHDTLIPTYSYGYNQRLNIANIKKTLSSSYNMATMVNYTDGSVAPFIEHSPTAFDWKASYRVYFFVKEEGRDIIIGGNPDVTLGGTLAYDTPVVFLYCNNPNAYKALITRQYIFNDGIEVRMERHKMLNGSYCFLGWDNIVYPLSLSEAGLSPSSEDKRTISVPNKIYTSEVNNPFHFPVLGINTVGTGTILGISAAAKAMSQGQFGQFPLYAFTTEGVWALEVSSTGSYSARQPITRDVCINTDSITQIDSSVLFATDRGIMLISGSQTQCITDSIFAEQPFNVLNLPCIDQLHTKIGHSADACLPTKPFLGFLAGCQMVYDYVHQRIFVFNPATETVNGVTAPLYTYAYVFSLKSKMWGMTFSSLKSTINSYPDALAMTHDNKLVSFSETDETVCKGLYITRPLKLEAADVHKTISALIQRGHFQRGDVGTVLYGSRDLYTWHLIWSSKDQYLRGFRGTPYKYFRIAGVATLTDGKSIFGASVNFEPRHTNQLR